MAPSSRRRTPQDRPVQLRVHPRYPLGSRRSHLCHRHASGHHLALQRLQARPQPDRQPPHRPRPNQHARPRPGHPPAAGRFHQRRCARQHRFGKRNRPCHSKCAGSQPRQTDHRGLLRQPPPSRAASRGCGNPRQQNGRHPRHVHAAKCALGTRSRHHPHPRREPHFHRRIRLSRARRALRALHRLASRAALLAGNCRSRRQPLDQARRRRHHRAERAPDPRQRSISGSHDQPHDGARSRSRPCGRASHLRTRQTRRAGRASQSSFARMVRASARRTAPHARPRRPSRREGHEPRQSHPRQRRRPSGARRRRSQSQPESDARQLSAGERQDRGCRPRHVAGTPQAQRRRRDCSDGFSAARRGRTFGRRG